ncbi:MAG: nickel-dependent lactate racemase [candidate division Zixibacteria bacterium]|nr:nickel-dependent lactate racemase [candidate division Zixibacteria bacterium]
MLVSVSYGENKLELKLPDSVECDYYECKAIAKEIDSHAFLGRITMAEKEQFLISQADLFVVNDSYRPTPTFEILNRLFKNGRLGKKAKFLVATGTHKPCDETQLKTIFGDLYGKLKNRILVHDARDKDSMTHIGELEDGHSVYINKYLYDAEKVVVIGSVEPHYFAGFTGGRKAIFPGVCDYETTVQNHRLAVSFDASPVKLEGNPVEQGLQSLMKLISDKEVLSIQTVMDKENKIQAVFCGKIDSSFRRACEFAQKIYSSKIKKRYDLLLAEVRPPLDCNLYQLQKSLENSQDAVTNGGTVILFSPCQEGIGSDSFYRLADKWRDFSNNTDSDQDDFGIHKLSRVAQIAQRIDVRLYSELDEDVSDKVFFATEKDPQKIIDKLTENSKGIRVALVHDAGHTVLRTH